MISFNTCFGFFAMIILTRAEKPQATGTLTKRADTTTPSDAGYIGLGLFDQTTASGCA